jgi:hypothetical protein
MATTGSFFTFVLRLFAHGLSGKPVPTFPHHAAGNKKAPDLHQAGASGEMMQFVRLRAHASRGPGGLFGRGGAFGGRDHGGRLMRKSFAPVNGFGPKIGPNEVEQAALVAP